MANQTKLWLVVKPTVGLPLFLGAVAVTALLVHIELLANTTWFSAYWNGGAKAKHAAPAPAAAPEATAPAAK
jgi:light-harvesting protein B-800-850 alpha chain